MSIEPARLLDLAAQHLLLALSALILGLVIALPLAVASARSPALRGWAIGFANLIQTIPSLALLALFYPLLIALRGVIPGVPALGFLPALLALTLYALLPILRNGVTGLTTIDPAVIEAADGIGMTAAQRLWLVEAPLVAPVLMAGIRTAAVWTIGAATLATTVGAPSLGDLIFSGLQTQSWNLVLVGCIASAALALGVDALLGAIERGIATRQRRRVWLAGAALLVIVAAAIVPRVADSGRPLVTVGAKGFSEQFILARLIGRQLERAGYRVRYREGLGSTIAFSALAAGDTDVSIDYAGTLWTNGMRRGAAPAAPAMRREIAAWVRRQHGITLLGPLGFENAYAFAMRGDDAQRRRIRSLDDLSAVAPSMAFATDVEFLDRPEWRAVRDAYGLHFASARPYNPTFMYNALAGGRADVISAFSSDGRIAADRLTVLTDPRGAIPNYDALLMIAPRRAGDARFKAALRPLIGRIPIEAMREANLMVDRERDKRSPEQAADWLATRVGLAAK